jgi:hypothetical protein
MVLKIQYDGLMEEQVSTREYSRRLVIYCLLAVLAPVYLVNIIPMRQWTRGVPVADSRLNLWALTHQWKVLPSNPADIWNGNAFYPAGQAITGSDHLFTQAVTGLPVYKITGNPFLTYHFVLFAGYAISAWGMFLLGLLLFRHAGGALAAAVFFTVALPRSVHAVGHLQIAYLGWLPWSIYFLHRMYRRNSVGVTAGFVVSTALHILSGWYMAYFHGFILAVLIPALALKHRQVKTLYICVVAVAVVFLLVLPFGLPYAGRPGVDTETWNRYAARPADFFTPASYTLFARGNRPFWSETTLWMGFTAPVLGMIGIFFRGRPDRMGRSPGVFPYLLLILIGGAIACGINLPRFAAENLSFGLLHRLPGIDGIRAPARAVFIVMFALSILFGRVIWLIEKRLPSKPVARIITVLAVAMVMIENFPLMPVQAAEVRIPPVYRWLESLPGRVVIAEAPCFYNTDLWAFEADYMMYAALHGHATVNGYSRFAPASYAGMSEALDRIPSPSAIRHLKNAGVDYLIVHPQMFFHHAMRDLFRQMEDAPDPVTVLNRITELSNAHYTRLVSAEGLAVELACLHSPYLRLLGRFDTSLVFRLSDLQFVDSGEDPSAGYANEDASAAAAIHAVSVLSM